MAEEKRERRGKQKWELFFLRALWLFLCDLCGSAVSPIRNAENLTFRP
jgi:hypothetical protein